MKDWTDVKNELPREEVSVVVYPFNYQGESEFSITGYLFEGNWYCEHGHPIEVTHWQPLPDAPKNL